MAAKSSQSGNRDQADINAGLKQPAIPIEVDLRTKRPFSLSPMISLNATRSGRNGCLQPRAAIASWICRLVPGLSGFQLLRRIRSNFPGVTR